MIFRPLIIFSKQTNTSSFFYYIKFHKTREDIGKHIICIGNNCELCKNNIKKVESFLIPILYIRQKFINVKVLYTNYEFTKNVFNIIETHLDEFNDNNLLKPTVSFIESNKIVKINVTDYIISKFTAERIKLFISDFDKNYIKKYFTDNKHVYDYYVKEYLNK